ESFTNWEAGLQKAVDVGPTDLAPVVIFFTDGVPNTVGTAGTSPNNNGDGAANSAAAAVGQIDAIKAAGSKVIAVGVGQVTTPANLARLAEFVEPTETPEIWDGGTELDLSTVDVISVTDFSGLESALAEAARNFCSQQLLIDKVDQNGAPITSPSVSFETTVTGETGEEDSYNFLVPDSDPPSATASTDGSGRAAFEWSAVGEVAEPANWTSTATFKETIPAGFTADPDNPGTCTVVPSRQGGDPVLSITDVSNGMATFALDDGAFEFVAGDVVTCSVRNVPQGTLIIEKVTTGGDDTFGFTGAGGAINGSITTSGGVGQNSLQATLPVGTYEVTESTIPAGWGLADATCDNQSGTLNGDTLSGISVALGQTTTCTFENAKVDVDITKTVTSQPTFANGEYTVAYDVVVTNNGPGETTYTLTDTPTFGTGANITGIAITGATTIPNYIAGTNIVENKAIAESASDTYTVTVKFTVDVDMTIAERLCDPDEPGQGTFNSATITFPGGTDSADDCANIPDPDLDITKTVTSQPTFANGEYTVVYDVVVTNPGPGQTTYTLTDTPTFGTGATITNIAISGAATIDPYTSPNNIVENKAINSGASDTYTVTVTFTVADTMTVAERLCDPDEPGQGTFNSATITFPGGTDSADDCANIPDPTVEIVKEVISSPALVAGSQYTVTYEIGVFNAGPGQTTYTLTDLPDFDDSVTIDNVAIGGTVTIDPYTPGNPIVTNRPIDASDIENYTVTVLFTVPNDLSNAARTCDGEPDSGAYNSATVTFPDGPRDGLTDDDCANIPDPEVDIDKTVTSAPALVSGNTYTVAYEVDVTNDGPGQTTYTLTDTPDFGDGATITNIAITGAANIDPYNAGDNIVENEPINAGVTDTYTVTVTFTVAPDMSTVERECDGSTSGQGTFNSATITFPGGTDTDDDCADIPDPDLTPNKFVSADPEYVGNGQWFLEYTITVSSNQEGGPAQYDLDDVTDFSPGVVADSLVFVSVNPNSIEPNINGEFGISDPSLATDVDISPGDVHTYVIGATVSTNYEGDVTYVECIPDAPLPDEGLYNAATVTVNGEPLDPVDACENLPGDLQMEKDDGGAIAIAGGDPFTYTLTVTNVGGVSTGEPVIVTDELPEQFEWVSFPNSDPVCTEGADQVLTCELPAGVVDTGGESFSFEVSAQAPAGTAPSNEGYENLSYVDSPLDPPPNPPVCPGTELVEFDPTDLVEATVDAVLVEIIDDVAIIADPDNNVACDRTPVEDAEIEVSKTDDVNDPDTVVNGEQFAYTIAVENTGTSTVEDVKIDDDLPAALTYVSIAPGAGWTCNDANPIACTYGPALDPGQTTTDVVVTVQVTESFVGESITNVVDASALLKVQGEEKEVTDSDDEVTPLEPTLDVGAFEPVCVGDFPYIDYTIVPKGFTPTGTATIEILDADMQLVETLNDQPLNGQILWPGASLDPADWPGWQLENGVWVEDGTDQFLRDGLFFRITVNPTATTALVPYPEATSACANPEQTSADLEILKAATTVTAPQGSTFEWILEVINNGPDLATGIVVTDSVP
ncbi:MAG: hypothetical protein AAFY28_15160, partial [Actinomycetota bacterium]